jgi:hypothetical protein
MYCNPKIYRHLIPKYTFRKTIEQFSPIQNVLGGSMLRFIEEMIRTDYQYANRA